MKKINLSLVLNLITLLFLFATFFLQYEFLFITRVVLIIFSIAYLVIELKKEYFISNKRMFIIFNVVSMIALIVSVLFDNASEKTPINERIFFIPVYVFILVVIMYRDLYDENK